MNGNDKELIFGISSLFTGVCSQIALNRHDSHNLSFLSFYLSLLLELTHHIFATYSLTMNVVGQPEYVLGETAQATAQQRSWSERNAG